MIFLLVSILFNEARWISYCDNSLGVFTFEGPERAMFFNPADFSITYPLQIESLKVRFYGGMGSWQDSVFVFKIYAGDGSTILFHSESLIAPRTLWASYGLGSPVVIDTGKFYVAVAFRRFNNPYAYPFMTTDNNPSPQKSFYGLPSSWLLTAYYGEYFIFAFVSWTPVNYSEETSKKIPIKTLPTLITEKFSLNPSLRIKVYGMEGELISPLRLETGDLPAGIYIIEKSDNESLTRQKVIKLK